MCLAIPMKVIKFLEVDEVTNKEDLLKEAVCEDKGVQKKVIVDLISDLKLGDFVMVHAGFAISKIDEESAKETIEMLKETKLDEF